MTRAVIARWHIDRTRIYVIGISAGAFETAIPRRAPYPDLYAAIGIHSGAAYMGGAQGCLVDGESPAGVNTLARSAFTVMGTHARLMPVIVFHGDKDGTIPYRCGRQALAQWLRTDDLILEHERRVPLPAAPTGGSHAVVPDGHAYTVDSFEDLSGCPVAQFWTIHGMGHYWSGGSADPASARYTDPRGQAPPQIPKRSSLAGGSPEQWSRALIRSVTPMFRPPMPSTPVRFRSSPFLTITAISVSSEHSLVVLRP